MKLKRLGIKKHGWLGKSLKRRKKTIEKKHSFGKQRVIRGRIEKKTAPKGHLVKVLLIILALALVGGVISLLDKSENSSKPLQTMSRSGEGTKTPLENASQIEDTLSASRETKAQSSTVQKQADEEESPSQKTDLVDFDTSIETSVSDAIIKLLPIESSFEIHFIDVGQADAALVLCDGRAMLIDGGNVSNSQIIYANLIKYSIDHLDYIICTHPHDDHVGGLPGALNYATADVALCPVTEYDSSAFAGFTKYLAEQGVSITVPKAGDSFSLGSAAVQVIGPFDSSNGLNNRSIVLRIEYGETSFLFTGDAEREEEQAILNAGYDLKSTVLKVGHHGGDTSTTYPFLREIDPEYAVISVGKDNTYGHPTEDTLSRLRDADVKVFRTDLQGDIDCISDGKTVSFSVKKNADADTLAPQEKRTVPEISSVVPVEEPLEEPNEEPAEEPSRTVEPEKPKTTYVLNTNTYKFHYTYCSSVGQMKEKNKLIYEGTRDEVIAMGYEPCKRCNP